MYVVNRQKRSRKKKFTAGVKIYKHIAGWEIHRENCDKNIENATT
jgi:hypothetical protein